MVRVGVRRQSRSPSDTAISSFEACLWMMTWSVSEFAGKAAAPQHCDVIFWSTWELAGKAAARHVMVSSVWGLQAMPQPPNTVASLLGQRRSSQAKASAFPTLSVS